MSVDPGNASVNLHGIAGDEQGLAFILLDFWNVSVICVHVYVVDVKDEV